MTETELKGHWTELKGKVLEQWGELTDDEFDEIAGKKDQLLAKLQQHYGYTKAKAKDELKTFLDNVKNLNGTHKLGESIREMGNRAQQFSHRLADKSEVYLAKGDEVNQQLHDKLDENCEQVVKYVKKHPVQSALIAAGIGLLIGKLLK